MDVVLIDAGARPSRGEAEGSRGTPNRRPPGKHNVPLASEAANSPIVQHSAAGNMSPSVDDVLSCLQKYDETHQDFYQRHAEVLAAKLHVALQNITNSPKTPTSPALESTPTSRPRRRTPQRRSSV